MRYYTHIGLRYLLSKKQNAMLSLIAVISFLGVALGVMALVVVLSVMNGFEQELKEKILGANSHLLVLSQAQRFTNYPQVSSQLRQVPGVVGVSPFVVNEVMLSSDLGTSSGVVIYGIDPASAGEVTRLGQSMIMGKLADLQAKAPAGGVLPSIIIGRQLSKELNALPGDTVTLIAPFAELTPLGVSPKIRLLKVVGVFETGMWQFDSKFVYLALPVAQKMFLMEGAVHGLAARVSNLDNVGEIAAAVRRRLGHDYRVRTWVEMNRDLFNAFKLEKTAMFIILAMIVLVASFNIVGTLILLVGEKNKEIALLKAIGASRREVMRIFIASGSLIGACGTALGLAGGYGLCLLLKEKIRFPLNQEIYQVDHLPVAMELRAFLAVAAAALLISFLATLYPSYKAASGRPAEGLRYE